MRAQKYYPFFYLTFQWSEVHYHYAVFVMFDDLRECYYKFDFSFVCEIAPEYRIMYGVSESFMVL
jgi:hypothetical protein